MLPRYRTKLIAAFAIMISGLGATGLNAQPIVPRHQAPNYISICETHTPELEMAFDLPRGVLTAISRVESGRPNGKGVRLGWPWTINHDGRGLFFENKQDMLAYARAHINKGDLRMDIGCMQISIFWHKDQFASLEEMADPSGNIAYAAAFLADLKDRHGNIDQAIRHYHNADPAANTPYVARVYDVWKNITDNPDLTLANIPSGQNGIPNTASTRAVPSSAKGNGFPAQASLQNGATDIIPVSLSAASLSAPPSEAEQTDTMAKPDPLAAVKQRQPHLSGKWDKVELFRKMLNP